MKNGMLLKPIKRVRLYENAVEQIQSLILRKHYKPSDRLPPERSLAEQLNISRPSLREALRILSVMGLIEIKVGDGIYVKEAMKKHMAEEEQALLTALTKVKG